MNKRLEEDIGKPVATSYNRRGALTRFAQQALNMPPKLTEPKSSESENRPLNGKMKL